MKRVRWILSLIGIFFIGSAPAHARPKGCAEFRLDRPGYSMAYVKPLHQPPALCSSYTLAQMIDAWRISHSKPNFLRDPYFRTSGFELAVAYAAKTRDPLHSRQGVSLYKLSHFLRHQHPYVCSDQDFDVPEGDADDYVFANALLMYWRQYSTYLKKDYLALLESHPQSAFRMAPGTASHRIATGLKCDLDPKGQLPLEKLAHLLREVNPIDYLKGIFDQMCKKRKLPSDLPAMVEQEIAPGSTGLREAGYQILYRLTEPNAQPVALNFCGNVRSDSGYRVRGQKDPRNDCLPHFALIVGQRYNPQRDECQYLIQDTAGDDCGGKDLSKAWTCENGKYWIDRGAILRNSFYYLQFSEKKWVQDSKNLPKRRFFPFTY